MESQRDIQVAKIQCRKFLRFCRDWVCSTWRKGGFAGARNSLLRSKMKLPREESLVLAVHDRRRDKLNDNRARGITKPSQSPKKHEFDADPVLSRWSD